MKEASLPIDVDLSKIDLKDPLESILLKSTS